MEQSKKVSFVVEKDLDEKMDRIASAQIVAKVTVLRGILRHAMKQVFGGTAVGREILRTIHESHPKRGDDTEL